MKNLIERILVIDRSAKAKLDEAVRKKEEVMRAIDVRKQQMDADLQEKSQQHLAAVEEAESATAADAIAKVQHKGQEEQARLQQIKDEYREQWVTELLQGIIPAE